MSKRKTRQQKIIADLHRKLQPQSAGSPTYTYKNIVPIAASLQPVRMTTNILSIKHDLIKTTIVTMTIIAAQVFLFYLLKNHLIIIPMVGY